MEYGLIWYEVFKTDEEAVNAVAKFKSEYPRYADYKYEITDCNIGYLAQIYKFR